MLLTELILSKRGPLAKVWLSAHHERKLSKQQALGVDVNESIDAILTQETEPIALRLSGQLMLGVVRIYSRKVQYLFDDCKETRERISLAFRQGIVDLPEDHARANKDAITFSGNRNDLDILDWTFTVPNQITSLPLPSVPTNLPRPKEYGAYNFGRPAQPSIYGGSTSSRSRQGSAAGDDDISHLDSQDFGGIDLGLGLDDFGVGGGGFGGDDSFSIGVGRDGMSERAASVVSGFKGFEEGDGNGQGQGMDFEFAIPDVPQLEDDRSRRGSTGLSTPPPISPPADQSLLDLTPRTTARITALNSRDTAPPKKRLRLVQADEELELADEEFNASHSLLDEVPGFIPRDDGLERIREILDDAGETFLVVRKEGDESFIYGGPLGLAPELQELFSFPSTILRKRQDGGVAIGSQDEQPNKRPRLESNNAGDEIELETGRRQSEAPSFGFDLQNHGGGDDSFNLGGGDWEAPDFTGQDDLTKQSGGPHDEFTTPTKNRERIREASLAPSRAESIARAIQHDHTTSENVLSIFDKTDSYSQSQSQTQSVLDTPTKSVYSEVRPSGTVGSSYSKNTGMALGLLRREIESIEGEIRSEKVLSFEKVAEKSSKRAASTFFFELLVLGTRDCINLEQKFPYEDIEVRGKDKLFQEITA